MSNWVTPASGVTSTGGTWTAGLTGVMQAALALVRRQFGPNAYACTGENTAGQGVAVVLRDEPGAGLSMADATSAVHLATGHPVRGPLSCTYHGTGS